jgi:hypothetical protein
MHKPVNVNVLLDAYYLDLRETRQIQAEEV